MIPCEIETPGGKIRGNIYPHYLLHDGVISVAIPSFGISIDVPLDDLTDDSRRLVLNSRQIQ